MISKLYIKHKLTAHHLRYRYSQHLRLAICNCGWHARWLKKNRVKVGLRRLKCFGRGHDWSQWDPIEVGAIYEEEGEYKSEIDNPETDSVVGFMRQCDRCWKCESIGRFEVSNSA